MANTLPEWAAKIQEPTPRAKATLEAHYNADGWKLPPSAMLTEDRELAEELLAACIFYLGGGELAELRNGLAGPRYAVTSKGYYHYIGA